MNGKECKYCGEPVEEGKVICRSCYFKQASGQKISKKKSKRKKQTSQLKKPKQLEIPEKEKLSNNNKRTENIIKKVREKSVRETFKEKSIEPPKYSSLKPANKGKRLLNFIIDQFVVFFGFVFLITFFKGSQYTIILLWISYLTYYFVMESVLGRTFGKLATGTIVVTRFGEKPNKAQILGRTFMRTIPFEPFSFLASDVGWHDKASKTLVVDVK